MNIIDNLIVRYPILAICKNDIVAIYSAIEKCFSSGNRMYICGNGGSAADALHIVGELTKSFNIKRKLNNDFIERVNDDNLSKNLQGALPAFALAENTAFTTAFSNDCNSEYIFAQQVYAYARRGDCVLGISTSGNSKNIINAINTAKGREAVTLGLSGAGGGTLKDICDICVCVPERETYIVQELHLPIYHAICLMLEQHFFGE